MDTSSRYQEIIKKNKKKWRDESKKYKENVIHMKEFQEETYQKKNKELVERLKKKDKLLLTALKNKQKNKMKDKQRAIESLMEKERIARENVEKYMIKQEQDRQNLQKTSNRRSK